MSKLAQFFLVITAFAPVFLMYAVVSLINCNYLDATAFVVSCAVLVFICIILLNFAKNQLQSRTYYTTTVEIADGEIFSLLLVYLLPLITRDLADYNWPAWFVVTFFFCLVVATSYGYHFNPLLVFFGYHFYKVTERNGMPYILITRRCIYTKGEKLKVGRLAPYILIEKTERKK